VNHAISIQDQLAPARRALPVNAITLERASAALVVCDDEGGVLGGSPAGIALLTRAGANLQSLPAKLSSPLWKMIASAEHDEAVQWRPGVSVTTGALTNLD
jgi:hypothetical protein